MTRASFTTFKFVDHLMSKLDREGAPAINTVLIRLREGLPREKIEQLISDLHAEYPELAYTWNKSDRAWQQGINVITPQIVSVGGSITAKAVYRPMDITVESPVRFLLFGDSSVCSDFAIQAHHARMDGYSMKLLAEKLARTVDGGSLRNPGDHVSENSPNSFQMMSKINEIKFRQIGMKSINLSRRALTVFAPSNSVGPPAHFGLRVDVTGLSNAETRDIFFTVCAAAVIRHAKSCAVGRVRFRVPLDLRRKFALRRGIGNIVSAIPLEFSEEEALSLAEFPRENVALFSRKMSTSLSAGSAFISLLETYLVSTISRRRLEKKIADEQKSILRTTSAVITYLGKTARAAADSTIQAREVYPFVPNQGFTGLRHENSLSISLNFFDHSDSGKLSKLLANEILEICNTEFGCDGQIGTSLTYH